MHIVTENAWMQIHSGNLEKSRLSSNVQMKSEINAKSQAHQARANLMAESPNQIDDKKCDYRLRVLVESP